METTPLIMDARMQEVQRGILASSSQVCAAYFLGSVSSGYRLDPPPPLYEREPSAGQSTPHLLDEVLSSTTPGFARGRVVGDVNEMDTGEQPKSFWHTRKAMILLGGLGTLLILAVALGLSLGLSLNSNRRGSSNADTNLENSTSSTTMSTTARLAPLAPLATSAMIASATITGATVTTTGETPSSLIEPNTVTTTSSGLPFIPTTSSNGEPDAPTEFLESSSSPGPAMSGDDDPGWGGGWKHHHHHHDMLPR
ncbi:hypothetical protein NP233_g2523 [Leucocoprinus birnbaumii]|uniref:Uncharacterized protein n=1 Tax=Leucocoprinus birnbaumii TaxID=56174 RepID=A0AAD5YYZ9_9AGAR|nr:hypothetical protein NP233_g2523 [Leucocoprinus birnbaumii]